ncbi:MAG: hypothetical protein LQ351_004257 [Letrouitia transgressa]|nr:MAG: hypothetical protein LQ351_004257 [Letrouitia transgressa]
MADAAKADCVQWIMESYKEKNQGTIKKAVDQTIGLLLASAHQFPMILSYIIFNLCIHPEYIERLRQESGSFQNSGDHEAIDNMPLLDSFIKESARLNPLDSLTMQRKAIQDYTFSDGTFVPAGNGVCVPQEALMHDPAVYPSPTEFNGYRFVTKEAGVLRSSSKFTHPSWSFPFWGAVGRAW